MGNIFNEQSKRFFQAILSLKDIDECEKFFTDAFTIREIKEISQRYAVAEMLYEGKIYNEIAKETEASTATISRVNKCLNYGEGGYKLVLDRMKSK